MGELIEPDFITSLDLPVEKVLRKATEAGLAQVVVVGEREDGEEYFASSQADAAQVIWHLQRAIWTMNKTIDRIVEEGLP